VASKIGNIVFDCANPRELSHFWADVMGYPRAEYPEDMREALLSAGLTEHDLAARSIAEDPTGESPRFYFQRVPEGKVVKNRVPVDVNATPGRRASPAEVDAEVERVVALGATVLHRADSQWGPYPEYHYVMVDPEGNEFCIQ
jgi:catechol 2,3-dioxygenase-like lactoylglutathione lyase family enzyme